MSSVSISLRTLFVYFIYFTGLFSKSCLLELLVRVVSLFLIVHFFSSYLSLFIHLLTSLCIHIPIYSSSLLAGFSNVHGIRIQTVYMQLNIILFGIIVTSFEVRFNFGNVALSKSFHNFFIFYFVFRSSFVYLRIPL